jgi:hypothetical protein
VRGLLDDAAVALHRTAYALDEMRSQVTQHTPGFFKSERGTEVFAQLDSCGKELDALLSGYASGSATSTPSSPPSGTRAATPFATRSRSWGSVSTARP